MTITNLALEFRERGDLEMAEQLLCKLLESIDGTDRPTDPTVIAARDLGHIYRYRGQLEKSKEILHRALKDAEALYGPENAPTLEIVCELLIVYRRQGKLVESEALCLRALDGMTKIYGPDHAETLQVLQALAAVHEGQERHDEAETSYRKAAHGLEKALGPHDRETARAWYNLGGFYSNRERHNEAGAALLRSLHGHDRVYGTGHIMTLIYAVHELGRVYARSGKVEEAIALYLRELRGVQRLLNEQIETALGPRPPRTLGNLWDLGKDFQDVQRPEEAEVALLLATQQYEKFYGRDHVETLCCPVTRLAGLYAELGRSEEALELGERARQGLEKALEQGACELSQRQTAIERLNNLGDSVYLKLGYLGEAEEVLLKALRGHEEVFGFDHEKTLAWPVNKLGVVYVKQGDIKKAEDMYDRARQGRDGMTAEHQGWIDELAEHVEELRQRIKLEDERAAAQSSPPSVDTTDEIDSSMTDVAMITEPTSDSALTFIKRGRSKSPRRASKRILRSKKQNPR